MGVSLVFFLYVLFLPDLGWREHAIGSTTSTMVLGGVVGVIPLAALVKKVGGRWVLSSSLAATAVFFAGREWLLSFPSQLVLSFFAGIALSGWIVCASPVIANSVPEKRRPDAFAVFYAIALVAGGLGGLLGGYLPVWLQSSFHSAFALNLGTVTSKRLVLLLGSVFLAIAAIPVLGLEPEAQSERLPRARPLNGFLLRFLLASICWNLAVGAFTPFAGLFFARHLQVPLERVSLIFCGIQCVQALGLMAISRWLQRSLGLVPAIVSMQLAAGVSLGLLSQRTGVAQASLLYALFTILQRMCEPAMQCVLMNETPRESRSMATAVCYLAISLAQATSADLGGYALQRFGYGSVLGVIGLASISAGICFALLIHASSGMPQAGVLATSEKLV